MYRAALKNEISLSELNYLRSQGLSNKEIASQVGCSAQTVGRYLSSQRKAKVKLSDQDFKDILELYHDGNTVKEIADSYNCSTGAIYRVLKTGGIDFQPKKAKQEVKEEPKHDISAPPQSHSNKMTVYQIGLYDGWKGVYKVNLTEHTVEFPELPKTMEKEELGFYIRDLMSIWKEM